MSVHEIAELLPFYANGTLDAAARARVDAELATCPECAAELREVRALASSVQARAQSAPPLPGRIIGDALDRIAAPPPSPITAVLNAWWSAPARYAVAASMVIAFGAVAAAYHAHEANLPLRATYDTASTANNAAPAPTSVERVMKVSALSKGQAGATAATAPANLAKSDVAKQHRLAKKAHLDLLVRDVESTLKAAQSTVRAAGGDVISLNDSSPHNGETVHTASLEVEVPAERLDAIIDRLAALGAVQNRAVDADDVDAAIVDEEARLRNLRREESDLRALMDKGGKVGDILTVQQNLSEVRGEIEQLDAQHRNDVHRVATSTIAMTLTEDRPNAAPAKPGPTARIDGAWHSGLNALGDAAVALLAAIVWCVAVAPMPLAIGAIAYAALRFAKGRISAA